MTNPRRNETHNQDDWFWPKVKKTESCWLWQASGVQGYGTVRFNGKKHRAHRVSYLFHFGGLPAGKPCVLHHCDTPACVRPDHLFAGTKKDNTQDMLRKRRARQNPDPTGENNGRAVLDWALVREIRRRYKDGQGGYTTLAREYGVTRGCIRDIVKLKTWIER